MIEGICKLVAEENLKNPGSWKGLGIPAISH